MSPGAEPLVDPGVSAQADPPVDTPANPHVESRVARRKRLTRERIFEAALDLFVRKGLDETTVAEIAESADIGKGTFFTYFPTKESIFAHVSTGLVARMGLALDAAAADGATSDARILAFFRPAVDWHAANPVLSRLMLGAILRDAAFAQADRPAQQALHARLADTLAAGQAAGEIASDADIAAGVTAIAGTYFGCLGAWHGAGRTTALASEFARALAIVLRGLRP